MKEGQYRVVHVAGGVTSSFWCRECRRNFLTGRIRLRGIVAAWIDWKKTSVQTFEEVSLPLDSCIVITLREKGERKNDTDSG